MKIFLFILGCVFCVQPLEAQLKQEGEYVVVAANRVMEDPGWIKVVKALQEKHQASVCYYQESPREVLDSLRKWSPRYVAIVEKPELIDRDFVITLHQMSREVDKDVYADYLWGIITGFDAGNALKLVENASEPLIVKSALSTIAQLNSSKWFDRYAWIDDLQDGLCGEKQGVGNEVKTYKILPEDNLRKFYDLYREYDPDFVVTSGHATERNLETPFSHGNIKSKNGVLYAAFPKGKENLVESGKRRVFVGAGNCLIGNIKNNRNSMAVAWLGSGNAAAMVGYVVTSWYGRSGWGALKYWLSNPGRYTLAEAVYLNEQDMLFQMNEWSGQFRNINYSFASSEELFRQSINKAVRDITSVAGIVSPTKDQIGFLYDRDVLAYYGDPKWDVRLQEIPKEKDYQVTYKMGKGKCVITVKTDKNFNTARIAGEQFKQEHVKDLPFSCFFPERLKNPRLIGDYPWKIAVDENFLFIYQPDFQPNKTYRIILSVD